MFQFLYIILALIAAAIHLAVSPAARATPHSIARTFLLYLLVFYVGLMELLAAPGQVFRPIQTAAMIGFAPSPFQYEVGMANLAIGVLGILCIWIRGRYWLAIALANAIWLIGDAIGHARQLAIAGNHAPYNSASSSSPNSSSRS